jgi:bacterioferritin-associated ferredoxin
MNITFNFRMIVCLCKNVCERRIRELARAGAETVGAVGRACGAGTDCGACRDQIAELCAEAREERRQAETPLLLLGLPLPGGAR